MAKRKKDDSAKPPKKKKEETLTVRAELEWIALVEETARRLGNTTSGFVRQAVTEKIFELKTSWGESLDSAPVP